MPEFKLNGKTYSGSTSYASAISYIKEDGSKTTVQDKISELNSKIVKYQDIVLESTTYAPNTPVYYEDMFRDYNIGYGQVISIVIIDATTRSHIAQFHVKKYGGTRFAIINDYTSALTDAVKIRIFYINDNI